MIKRTLICLLVVASFFSGQSSVQLRGRPAGAVTEEQLALYFQAHNREYFENKLPPTEIHFVRNLKWDGTLAFGITFPGNPYRISLEKAFASEPKITIETLLHEECHEAVNEGIMDLRPDDKDEHGPQWQKCMTRLAENGAFAEIW